MADSGLMFKIVFTIILVFVLSLIITVHGAPADLTPETPKANQSETAPQNITTTTEALPAAQEENHEEEDLEEYDTVLDQRQKGIENYRITLKDIVLIWAPSNTLLAAAALLDPQNFLGGDWAGGEDLLAPEKPQDGEHNSQNEIIFSFVDDKDNSTAAAAVKPPEKEHEKPVFHPTTKPAQLKRYRQRYPTVVGPFLRRTTKKE